MFQIAVLASGSKGNSAVIRTSKTKILLDAGLSGKRIMGSMAALRLNPQKLDAVVVSHEHNDHIRGAGIICRRLKVPLYISQKTYESCNQKLGKLPAGQIHFEIGKKFRIKDLEIEPFVSSHDAVDSCNFIFKKSGSTRKLALVTDVGYSSRLMLMKLRETTTLVLESNHDEKMLLDGEYPWHLKQRVKSKHGHLSNNQAVGVISQIVHPQLENLVLAHLSENNNLPDLARKTMMSFLQEIKHELNLVVARQDKNTELIDI
jgi:phosphoribosyl 1,2-cyclic phosphodiesterase